jgi:hypothetical protein
MINKEGIEKINELLREGNKRLVAKKAGVHWVTVYNFFGGKEDLVGGDTQIKIMDAALEVLKDRQKREKAIAKKTNSLLR